MFIAKSWYVLNFNFCLLIGWLNALEHLFDLCTDETDECYIYCMHNMRSNECELFNICASMRLFLRVCAVEYVCSRVCKWLARIVVGALFRSSMTTLLFHIAFYKNYFHKKWLFEGDVNKIRSNNTHVKITHIEIL